MKSSQAANPSNAVLQSEIAELRAEIGETRMLAIAFAGTILVASGKAEPTAFADHVLRILRLGAAAHPGFLAAIDDVEIIAKGTSLR
jgi:hypothetical protein